LNEAANTFLGFYWVCMSVFCENELGLRNWKHQHKIKKSIAPHREEVVNLAFLTTALQSQLDTEGTALVKENT
jgi:hypothetical protein